MTFFLCQKFPTTSGATNAGFSIQVGAGGGETPEIWDNSGECVLGTATCNDPRYLAPGPLWEKTGKPGTYVRREKQLWPPSPQPPKLPTFPAASVRGEAKGGLWETGLAGEEEGEKFCCEVTVGKPPWL